MVSQTDGTVSYTPAGTTTTETVTTTYNQLQTDTDYLYYVYDYSDAGTTTSTTTLITTGTSETVTSADGTATTTYITTSNNTYYNNTACSTSNSTCNVYELDYGSDRIDIHIDPSNTKLVIAGKKNSSGTMESQIIGTTSGQSNNIVIVQYQP